MRIVVATPAVWVRKRPAKSAERARRFRIRVRTRWIVLGVALLLAAVFGATAGYFVRLDMPPLQGLEEYAPAQMTRILARDGALLTNYASEKRILLDHGDIPVSFRQALIASEDSRFDEHAGVDLIGGLRALWSDLRHRRLAQGASTLTMQLAGNLFLDRSKRTVRRKLQEAVLAIEIERQFSKQEILATYCNHVHFGHGLYGLEAAARYYFGKPARALNTGESATLVGLLPRPASYSPLRNPEKSTRRRNLVLQRMVAEGYLEQTEADGLSAEPIVVAPRDGRTGEAAYFNEEVRRTLQETYGSGELYRGGMLVRTTLDPRLQTIAERAVQTGLAQLDDRLSRQKNAQVGKAPVQAALVAIQPSSGEILAMVGGRDFENSEFNRAMQARRQPGSLFKPFVYAAALARGWTLADSLLDEPTVFLDRRNPVPYQPENFSRTYHGTITLRAALEKSVNIPTVKLLRRIGYDAVIDVARRLGVQSRLRPYPSLALGAFELSLLEVTSAYGAFANQGLLMQPHYINEITNGGGKTVHLARPDVTEAVSPQVAYLMNRVLTGVVRQGTGKSAGRVLEQTLAGKTGTTDDNTDAWFVGYARDLVVGVWVGYDEPSSLGHRETGARAALPIWIEFMREALVETPDEPFSIPPGVTSVTVDRLSGCRPDLWSDRNRRVAETFVEGTEPTRDCTLSEERLLLMPYPFQRYPLDDSGALLIPANELDRILARELQVRHDDRRGLLEMPGLESDARVPVKLLPETEPLELPAVFDDLDPDRWTGTDGRRARIVWFDDAG